MQSFQATVANPVISPDYENAVLTVQSSICVKPPLDRIFHEISGQSPMPEASIAQDAIMAQNFDGQTPFGQPPASGSIRSAAVIAISAILTRPPVVGIIG